VLPNGNIILHSGHPSWSFDLHNVEFNAQNKFDQSI